MDEMRAEYEAMKLVPKTTLKEMLTNQSLRSPLIIAVMMMLAQQLSGINAVIYFSTDIFNEAGLDSVTSQYATLGMGGMNVLMTVISLLIIERAGRKTLMLVGLGGMLIDVILLTVCLALKVHRKLYSVDHCWKHWLTRRLEFSSIGYSHLDRVHQHHPSNHVRGHVRHRTRLYPLVLGNRTVRPGRSCHGHLRGCHCQLDRQLCRRTRFPTHSGTRSMRK